MIQTLITVIHLVTAVFMVLVVLVQGGHSGGVGAAFGGGNSSGVFGATGATSFLGKLTYGAAAIFMITSLTLTVMQGSSGDVGLKDRLQKRAAAENPSAAAAVPPASAAAVPANPVSAAPAAAAPAAASTAPAQ